MKDTAQELLLRREQEPHVYIAACREEDKEVIRSAPVEGQTGPLIKAEMDAYAQWGYPSQPGLNNLKDNVGCSFQGEKILKMKESSQNFLLIKVLVGCTSRA